MCVCERERERERVCVCVYVCVCVCVCRVTIDARVRSEACMALLRVFAAVLKAAVPFLVYRGTSPIRNRGTSLIRNRGTSLISTVNPKPYRGTLLRVLAAVLKAPTPVLVYDLEGLEGRCRGTSIIRNRHPVGPYSRTMPRLLWRP